MRSAPFRLAPGARPSSLFHHAMMERGLEGRSDRHIQQDSSCRPNREQHGEKPVDGGSVRDGGQVRTRVAIDRHVVAGVPQRSRGQVSDGIERAPEQRTADRSKVRTSSGFRLILQERLVEAFRARHVTIEEVLVLVLEREVVVEPERSEDTRSTRPRPKSRCAQ